MDALVNYSSDDDQEDSGNEISASPQWSKDTRTPAKDGSDDSGDGGDTPYYEKCKPERKQPPKSEPVRKSNHNRNTHMSSSTNSGNSSSSSSEELRQRYVNKKSTTPPPIVKYSTSRTSGGAYTCRSNSSTNRDEDTSAKRYRRDSSSSRVRDTKESRQSKDLYDNAEITSRKKHKSERSERHERSNRSKDTRDTNYRRSSRDEGKGHKYSSQSSAKEYYNDYKKSSSNKDHHSSSSTSTSKNSSRHSGGGSSSRRHDPNQYSSQYHHQYHQHQPRRSYDERSHKQRRESASRSRSRSGSPRTPSSRSSKHERRQRRHHTRDMRSKSHSRSRSRSQSLTPPPKKVRAERQQVQRERTLDVVDHKMLSNNVIPENVTRSITKVTSPAAPTSIAHLLPAQTVATPSLTPSTNATHIVPLMSLKFGVGVTAPRCPPNLNASSTLATPTNNNIASGSELPAAGVQLPSYYNPSVINVSKYAEQVQKRKLLWGSKKTEDAASKWGHAQFSQDSDGKVASKFMRLMGIKNANNGAETGPAVEAEKTSQNNVSDSLPPSVGSDVQTRERMFSSMEKQYEVARQATHTMRGVGLGFGTQPRTF